MDDRILESILSPCVNSLPTGCESSWPLRSDQYLAANSLHVYPHQSLSRLVQQKSQNLIVQNMF